MQAWGIRSRFTERDTGREPSKSGVIGVLCCALGKPRNEDEHPLPLARLAQLRLGVRVDREGLLRKDYHTAGGGTWGGSSYGVYKARGKRGDPVLSSRYYLAGAHFLVGVEGESALLEQLYRAIQAPKWQISFGRKALIPALPIHLPPHAPEGPGISPEPLETALQSLPLGSPLEPIGEVTKVKPDASIRFVVDALPDDDSGDIRMDVPIDFERRLFAPRRVKTSFIQTSQFPQRHS
jgi:CRISPR system Cascade subunit CasD